MKIINANLNIFFALEQRKPFRGCASGIARIILGIAQCAINSLALLFLAIPYKIGVLKKWKWIDFNRLKSDAIRGLLHIGRGIEEFLFTSDTFIGGDTRFQPDSPVIGYKRLAYGDDPYNYEMTKCKRTFLEAPLKCRSLHPTPYRHEHYVIDPL